MVRAVKSQRIYKLTIEQKVEVSGGKPPQTEVYCKMRYLGTEDQLYHKDKNSIFEDLQLFYEEFAEQMQESLEPYEELDDDEDE